MTCTQRPHLHERVQPADLVNRLAEWRGLLKRQTPIARQVLSKLLADKIVWTPRKDEGLYEFAGRARFDRTLAGIVDTVGRESPYRYHTLRKHDPA